MKEIPLTKGYVAFVDDEDYEFLAQWKWRVLEDKHTFYAVRNTPNQRPRKIRMHRLILNPPEGMETDHINGNGLDNRRCNLRACTHQENLKNREGWSQKTGYKGVRYRASRRKWCAQIRVDGKIFALGEFSTEEEAALAYNKAAVKHNGEFARLNKI